MPHSQNSASSLRPQGTAPCMHAYCYTCVHDVTHTGTVARILLHHVTNTDTVTHVCTHVAACYAYCHTVTHVCIMLRILWHMPLRIAATRASRWEPGKRSESRSAGGAGSCAEPGTGGKSRHTHTHTHTQAGHERGGHERGNTRARLTHPRVDCRVIFSPALMRGARGSAARARQETQDRRHKT